MDERLRFVARLLEGESQTRPPSHNKGGIPMSGAGRPSAGPDPTCARAVVSAFALWSNPIPV